MSDYSEAGAQPVDDAAVDDPPTEAEVRRAQEEHYPEQAATRVEGGPPTVERLRDEHDEQDLERRPEDGQLPSDTDVQAERQDEGLAGEHVDPSENLH
jgi:hypothetical protein